MRFKLLLSTSFLILTAHFGSFAQENNHTLWYNKVAEKWTDALPIGNGRLGAMIFSGAAVDHIQFNEETVWTGKPRDYNRKGAYQYLPEIRKLLFEGKQAAAEALAQEHFMGLQSTSGDRKIWVNEMKAGKGIQGNPALANFGDQLWKTIKVPAYEGWETVGLANLDGAVWFRTTFDVPENWAGKDLVLDLNRIRDQDFTYINGELVGNTDNTEPRKYTIPAKLIKKGKNVIAIQVLNYFDKGGLAGYKDTSKKIGIYPIGSSIEQGISLHKEWKYKIQDEDPPAVPQYQGSYQPFGDLNLYFKQTKSIVTNYKRSLDISTAVAKTTYTLNGVNYQREYFASQPNQVIVIHLTADKKASISFDAELSSAHRKSSVKALGNNVIALSVQVKDGAIKGESRLTALIKNGSVKVVNDKISINQADEVTLYLTGGTNFINAQDVSGNPAAANVKALNSLKGKPYTEIKQKHIKEYQSYYNTFSVDFGRSDNENLPTDERLAKFATANDPAFAALYMQYGRYLLISSSRPGTQPANLQGIWNDLLTPPWGSKYTTNINLEMNYWPTEILNLSALNEPLFNKIKGLAKTGAETAKAYYNANGWVLHHNTDLWNGTAPINASNHGIWVSGGGWLSDHLWEHYQFSKDRKFLESEAYPLMKQAALFYEDFLVKDPKTGWLISTPSNSPENGGLVAGPTMDHQIIRSLFTNCITAAETLNTDAEFRKSLTEKVKQLAPNQIGKYGQLQEWLTDVDDTASKHRHVSHLWGVYPGNDITWDSNEKMMQAAKQSLLYRGDDATGWSLAWKINFWARFKDGDHAMKLVKMLMKPANNGAGSYVNLFDAHPPFQIDGNFGGAAGIAEMVVQSHQGYLDILPALPTAIPNGEIKGLLARGGFELDLTWDKGILTSLTIKSKTGGNCKIRYKNNNATFETKAGESYKLNGDLKAR
ncbi:glycoside hydrolase N-terminal domain-containing protein [Pedobacter sp. ISL-68]|uniref:glycoside hydrolase family 95 protein n=1 Tax=unclassified Pedobacter TaxID=2628915 RepID=UPI001BE9811F|nr:MULTISPECIES: glycoside hydrolase N-terminal domain-containing protein [unclassified Pedobacter]MBT2561271.1 glycoside hydrolase N-terminal domain-containing protein [Pedobacter sp. ISL-64]MBT2590660.1 glycoside hydrolase N-terminal domain-containing protein [Pedobacter sp. ISL-68]